MPVFRKSAVGLDYGIPCLTAYVFIQPFAHFNQDSHPSQRQRLFDDGMSPHTDECFASDQCYMAECVPALAAGGHEVGSYTLEEQFAKGGFGEVWRGASRELPRLTRIAEGRHAEHFVLKRVATAKGVEVSLHPLICTLIMPELRVPAML